MKSLLHFLPITPDISSDIAAGKGMVQCKSGFITCFGNKLSAVIEQWFVTVITDARKKDRQFIFR